MQMFANRLEPLQSISISYIMHPVVAIARVATLIVGIENLQVNCDMKIYLLSAFHRRRCVPGRESMIDAQIRQEQIHVNSNPRAPNCR